MSDDPHGDPSGFSEATTNALAGVLYRTFEPKTATLVGWDELTDHYDADAAPVARYTTAAAKLLGDPAFRIIAGAISFPGTLRTLVDMQEAARDV